MTTSADARLTKAQRKGLEWLVAAGPTTLFPADGPSQVVLKRLRKRGLIEECGRENIPSMFVFTKFQISPAGRAALAAEGDK